MADNTGLIINVTGGGFVYTGSDRSDPIGSALGIAGVLDNFVQEMGKNPALSKLVGGLTLGNDIKKLYGEIESGEPISDGALIAVAADILALAALAAGASLSGPALLAISLVGMGLSAYANLEGQDSTIADWFSRVPPESQWAFDPDQMIFYDGEYDPFQKHALNGINLNTHTNFNDAKNFRWPVDPLVLDLDGDGIETLGIDANNRVLFDHDNDGVKTGTGWVSADDGLLVLDRNGNGTIDSGRELFGDQTLVNGQTAEDGYAALSAEDTNANGIFDAGDANFDNVRIWQDKNSDGISQADELHTLAEVGIASIGIDSTDTNITTNGNVQSAEGIYTKTDGTTGTTGNLDLAENTFYREFTEKIELTETAKSLAEMQGSGMVRDLREASTISTSLTSTLQGMQKDYKTHDEMMTQVDTVISQWAATSTMLTSVQQANLYGDELVYLGSQSQADIEIYFKFKYNIWQSSPSSGTSGTVVALDSTVDESQRYNEMLMEQARITNMISILERFNGETFVTVEPDEIIAPGAGTFIRTDSSSAPSGGGIVSAVWDPPMIVALAAPQVDFLEQSYNALKQSIYDNLGLQTRLKPYMDAVELTITADGIGLDMNGVFELLNFKKEESLKDAVIDWAEFSKYASSNLNLLDPSSLHTLYEWMEAVSSNPEAREYLDEINEALYAFGYDGENVVSIDPDTGVISGTKESDVMIGNATDDIMHSGLGDDKVFAGDGDDTINGEGGNDILFGGNGDDIIIAQTDGWYQESQDSNILKGGKGNDSLEGGGGDDMYLFNRGDGYDIIHDKDSYRGNTKGFNAGNDTISFGEGITEDDIVTKRDENNLIIALKEEGVLFDDLQDTILVKDWYILNNQIERLVFTGGNVMDITDMVSAMGTFEDDVLEGTLVDDTLYGRDGNDIINGGGGTDTLIGGAGDDIIVAKTDNGYQSIQDMNLIIGGSGNDSLQGGAGDDTYVFNRGDGQDIIHDFDRYRANTSAYNAGNDTISFGEGITADDLIMKSDGENLIIAIKEEGVDFLDLNDKITVVDWYHINNKIENILFTDGSSLNTNGIMLALGTDADDLIKGTGLVDILDGKVGNDIINAGYGDDEVYGGAGNDSLYGEGGHDTLVGGSGDDFILAQTDTGSSTGYSNIIEGGTGNDDLQGGAGDDTYIFNRGDGQDVIHDKSSYRGNTKSINAGNDTIVFTEGISASNITAKLDGNNLIIALNEENVSFEDLSDKIVIIDWLHVNNRIETLEFEDGTILDINGIINAMGTEQDNDIQGTERDDVIYGRGGSDTLYGGAGDDVLSGGTGVHDYLNGGTGNDTYLFAKGDGNTTINTYDSGVDRKDSLKFAEGISVDDISMENSNNNLLVTVADTGEIITIQNFFIHGAYEVNTIEFADGTSLDTDAMRAMALIGTDAAESITGYSSDDIIDGKAGDDTLSGGTGSDTYLYAKGDGNTTINNYDTGVDSVDTLRFAENITVADVTAKRLSNHLLMTVAGTNEVITVQNFFLQAAYELDAIEFADGTVLDTDAMRALALIGTDAAESITGYASDDILKGMGGSDTLNGGAGNDVLSGGTGVNDYLNGGTGDDTYVFTKGDGNTTIFNLDSGTERNDVLKFTEGISVDDISMEKSNYHLLITVAGTDEVITVQNFFIAETYALNAVEFFDGTVLDTDAMRASALIGTDTAEILTGYASDDILKGMGGNDTLNGGTGNDTLEGGSGSDTLNGGAGNDVLSGSTGSNDYLNGGTGNDTYLFAKGDGDTTIYTYDSGIDRKDILKFAEGISVDDISMEKSSNHLLITVAGTDEVITVQNFFIAETYALNAVEFFDGTVLDTDAMRVLTLAEIVVEPEVIGEEEVSIGIIVSGSTGDDVLNAESGDDTLYGNAGSDVLHGGAGDDILMSDDSATYQDTGYGDTLEGGTGNDTLEGGAGDDVYVFKRGDGQDTISDYDHYSTTKNYYNAGNDTISFGAGITQDDITFDFDGSDLSIQYGVNDSILVQNQSNVNNAIERFELSDGNFLSNSDLDLMIQQLNAYAVDNGIDTLNNDTIRNNEEMMQIVTSSWNV